MDGKAGDGLDLQGAARCRELTRDMLRTIQQPDAPKILPETWAWLIARYKHDEISPFRDAKANTREIYSWTLSRWELMIGEARIDVADYAEIKRWQKLMKDNGRSVAYIKRMFTMLWIVAGYGVAIRAAGAKVVKEVLGEMRIKAPKPRTASPIQAQIDAIVAAADKAGDYAFATGLLIQWWLTLRAVDVRGQWLRMTPEERTEGMGGITRGNFRWADGLTWDMIDRDINRLDKTPSKTEEDAPEVLTWDLTLLPEVRERLLSVPVEKRVGPVITDAAGVPFDRHRWSQKFREYRDAAQVPPTIKMMDTRAGAINHPKRAGASHIELQHQANHSQSATTDRYVRERSDAINKVVRLRRGNST